MLVFSVDLLLQFVLLFVLCLEVLQVRVYLSDFSLNVLDAVLLLLDVYLVVGDD